MMEIDWINELVIRELLSVRPGMKALISTIISILHTKKRFTIF